MSSKQTHLNRYASGIRNLIISSNVDENEFRLIYYKSIKELEVKGVEGPPNRQFPNRCRWKLRLRCYIFMLFFLPVAAYSGYHVNRVAIQTFQEYIYPGLRLLRSISIPLIQLFPSVSDLYDESCLLQNPLFRVTGMECEPCSNVKTIIHNNEHNPTRDQYRQPFIYKTNQETANISELERLYNNNKEIFDKDSSKIYVSSGIISVREMFNKLKNVERSSQNYYVWRMTRIVPTQILRTLIPRPVIIPQRGQSIEKFVIIDFSNKNFMFPEPECNFAYLLQIKGERLIRLLPADECKIYCKPLTMLLKESHLLWFNWWYWRPGTRKVVTNATLSITYMGSYC